MAAEGEPVAQVPCADAPVQRREPVGAQRIEHGGVDQRWVGHRELAFGEDQRAEPLDPAGHQLIARPAHLVLGRQQRRADLPGGRFVNGRRQSDPGAGLTRRPVSDRDRQPR